MTKTNLFIFTAFVIITSCDSSEQQKNRPTNEASIRKDTLQISKTETKFEATEIDCDTVYKGKGYKNRCGGIV
jgi:hypothetical protein